MDYFMVAFVLCLVGLGIYYLTRQVGDPGVNIFPFNSLGEYIDPALGVSGNGESVAPNNL